MAAGWLAGEHFSGQFDRQLADFRSMRRVLHKLEAGFRTRQDFTQMLQGLETIEGWGHTLCEAGRRIEQGKIPDQEFWHQVFEGWAEEVRCQFAVYFTQLAVGDRTLREVQLAEMQGYISEEMDRLQEEKSSSGKLYRSLGVLLGTAAAIMVL